MKRKILYICGSLNQTKMMHSISMHLGHCRNFFSPYYADGIERLMAEKGFLDFTILGGQFRKNTEEYLSNNKLEIDYRGEYDFYDIIFTCTDVIVPNNIKGKKVILVQEGMTDKENILFEAVKRFKLPRYIAGTAATGLSHNYEYFCVASEGYRNLFIKKGVNPEKIRVTGIPNFDNCSSYLRNNFPFRDYVLAATSDTRETFKYENRKKFIEKTLRIADGRQVIFKLHPNEKYERAAKEIEKYAPGAMLFRDGNTNHMIANCDVLVTRYSSVVYVGLALGKDVYSDFNIDELKELLPIQNNGSSAYNIAQLADSIAGEKTKVFNMLNRKSTENSLMLKPVFRRRIVEFNN